jgi:hypothetical protein
MRADPEHLRRHYSTLSDEALLAIDRAELIEMAQRYYDAELEKRSLAPSIEAHYSKSSSAAETDVDLPPDLDFEPGAPDDEHQPEWVAEAAEAYSVVEDHSGRAEQRLADARQVLGAAHIPCCVELVELSEEEKRPVLATHRYRLLVPASLSWRAMSTLERDLANPDFEQAWRAQLQACSDRDLPSMRPQIVFCHLFDQVERMTRAFEEEVARRSSAMSSAAQD